jgi:DNA polymerase III sliding clamp (beta) subunit (PCNA family)
MGENLTINKKDLIDVLKKAFMFSDGKRMQILAYTKIEVNPNNQTCKVTSTNNDYAFISKVGIETDSSNSFSFLLSKNYLDFLSKYKSKIDTACIHIRDKIPCITDQAEQVLYFDRLQVSNTAENFPELPNINTSAIKFVISELDIDKFQGQLKKAVIHSAISNIKYAFHSVRIFTDEGKIKICSTDSHRLYLAELKDHNNENQFDLLIPRPFMEKLLKIMNKKSCFTVSADDRQVFFETGNDVFISRLVDGMFPNIKVVIPKEKEIAFSVSFDKQELQEILEYYVNVGKTNKEESYKLVMNFRENTIEFYNQDDLKRISNLISYSGESTLDKICLSSSMMLDYVKNSIQDKIIMKITGSIKPVIFTDETDFALIMPIQIKQE